MDPHNLLILAGIAAMWFLGGMLLARINRTIQCAECPHCKKLADDKAARQADANHEYEHRMGMACQRQYCRINEERRDD